MYEFLRFYNNNGEYTNFSYDSSLDKWTGRIDMHTISVDLIENFDLFLSCVELCVLTERFMWLVLESYCSYILDSFTMQLT